MSDIALEAPGIIDSVAFPGLSIAGFSAAPNEGHRLLRPEAVRGAHLAGAVEVRDPRQGQRRDPADPGRAHVRRAAARVDGLGNAGGFKLQVQDREGLGEQALYGAVWGTLGQVYGNPKSSIGTPYSTYDINVPQLFANVDRARAKQMGVTLGDIYDTMQVNLGSLYVNDFTQVRQDLPGDRPGGRAVSRRRRGDRPR